MDQPLDHVFDALLYTGVLGNRGKWHKFQGNKGRILRGTGEQRQYWGTGNMRKEIFDFGGPIQFISGEQGNRHPRRASFLHGTQNIFLSDTIDIALDIWYVASPSGTIPSLSMGPKWAHALNRFI